MKHTFIMLFCLLFAGNFTVLSAQKQKIAWLTPEEAFAQNQKPFKKKIFVDVFTEWCGWCKKMDKDTFSDTLIADIMNLYFHAVKFDAESPSKLVLGDSTYTNPHPQVKRSTHQWAVKILNGQLSYPSFAFLDSRFNLLVSLPGYKTPENFAVFLCFIGRDDYVTQPWEEYQKTFKDKTLPKVKQEIARHKSLVASGFFPGTALTWESPENAFKAAKGDKQKKVFVDVYTEWCGWCKRMDETTFSNPIIVAMLKTYFIAVKFNAEQGSDVILGDQTYALKSLGGSRKMHSWATAILGEQAGFPSYAILKSDFSGSVNIRSGFQDATEMEMYLAYFGRGDDKKYAWETYQTIYDDQIRPKVNQEILSALKKEKKK